MYAKKLWDHEDSRRRVQAGRMKQKTREHVMVKKRGHRFLVCSADSVQPGREGRSITTMKRRNEEATTKTTKQTQKQVEKRLKDSPYISYVSLISTTATKKNKTETSTAVSEFNTKHSTVDAGHDNTHSPQTSQQTYKKKT